jgi:predicted outer membrane protein
MWRDHHLAQAERHIAEAKQQIARQRDFIAMLGSNNQPSEPAVLMLQALETSLKAFEHHRRLLVQLYSWKRQSFQRERGTSTVLDLPAAE